MKHFRGTQTWHEQNSGCIYFMEAWQFWLKSFQLRTHSQECLGRFQIFWNVLTVFLPHAAFFRYNVGRSFKSPLLRQVDKLKFWQETLNPTFIIIHIVNREHIFEGKCCLECKWLDRKWDMETKRIRDIHYSWLTNKNRSSEHCIHVVKPWLSSGYLPY